MSRDGDSPGRDGAQTGAAARAVSPARGGWWGQGGPAVLTPQTACSVRAAPAHPGPEHRASAEHGHRLRAAWPRPPTTGTAGRAPAGPQRRVLSVLRGCLGAPATHGLLGQQLWGHLCGGHIWCPGGSAPRRPCLTPWGVSLRAGMPGTRSALCPPWTCFRLRAAGGRAPGLSEGQCPPSA